MKWSKIPLFLAVGTLAMPALTLAQSRFVNVEIDAGAAQSGPEEPTIAISLKDTSRLVAGANINRVYYSEDGGRSWNKNTLKSRYGVWGDPAVTSNYKGQFFFFHLSDPTGLNWQSEEILDRMVVQRGGKKGKRWDKGWGIGHNPPKDQDKEWPAVNPQNNALALTWTEFDKYNSKDPECKSRIRFSQSNARGKKWSEAIQINQHDGNCLDDMNSTEGAVPAFGPNGEIYVSWAWNERIWFDYSLDGGKTWLDEDIVAAEQPGGWKFSIPGILRSNGFPITLCDVSNGEHHGTIYINWSDQRNGEEDTDVFVAKSTDGGKTFSEPIRVNDDESGKHQFFTWMTIDQTTGFLYSVFYDRRNYSDTQTDVYLAYSFDGGNTWTNERISEKPFVPSDKIFFGDYNNIAAHKGMIRPIWTRLHGDRIGVHTAIIYERDLRRE